MAKKLNQLSGMPQMHAAFAGWFMPISLKVITQTIVDGFNVDSEKTITFKGTIQPLSPKQIALKPEGQRAWKWLQIHCEGSQPILTTNDRIVYNGEKFKVMGDLDYRLNNFSEYHCVKDYE